MDLNNKSLFRQKCFVNGNWIEINNHDDVNVKKSERLSNIESEINRMMNKNNQ